MLVPPMPRLEELPGPRALEIDGTLCVFGAFVIIGVPSTSTEFEITCGPDADNPLLLQPSPVNPPEAIIGLGNGVTSPSAASAGEESALIGDVLALLSKEVRW